MLFVWLFSLYIKKSKNTHTYLYIYIYINIQELHQSHPENSHRHKQLKKEHQQNNETIAGNQKTKTETCTKSQSKISKYKSTLNRQKANVTDRMETGILSLRTRSQKHNKIKLHMGLKLSEVKICGHSSLVIFRGKVCAF